MRRLPAFVANDRRNALARGETLPERVRGAVLFADITGYTALIRRAQEVLHERAAEEMTRLVNHVLDRLITHVQRYDGVVINFGGDAVTCWFDADLGLRAAMSGLAIQQAMRGFVYEAIPELGPLSLSVKISIVVGSGSRIAVGMPEIQLLDVLTGEVMNRLVEFQHCAETNEVIMEDGAAALLGAQIEWELCEQQTSGRSYARIRSVLVKSVPDTETMTTEPPSLHTSNSLFRTWVLSSVYESLIRGGESFLAEIRPAVVVFLRFSGSVLNHSDDTRNELNMLVGLIQQTVDRRGGFVIKTSLDDKGSYVMCTFGAPLAREAYIIQALAATLELRTAISEYPFITQVQIGLAAGELLAGAFGNEERAAYDLLGPAANLAARLMMQARPNQILVTEEIAELMSTRFQSDFLEIRELKGVGEVKIYELKKPVQRKIGTFPRRLVGRDQEQRRLRQWQREALRGLGRTLQIEGAAGVGKSHLRDVLVEKCKKAGFLVAQGLCDSSYWTAPYAPWRTILLSLLGVADLPEPDAADSEYKAHLQEQVRARVLEINPEWEARLPILLEGLRLSLTDDTTGEAYSSGQRQEYFFTAVIDLLRDRAQRQPLLIVIEDAHWIDEASLLLALAANRILSSIPALLMLIHRPIEPEHHPGQLFAELMSGSNAVQLHLSELSLKAIRSLAQESLNGNVSGLLLSLLHVLARGNPFHTLELLNMLLEQQDIMYLHATKQWTLSNECLAVLRREHCLRIDPSSGEWLVHSEAPLADLAWKIPATLDETVRVRIDRLPAPHRLTLKIASVIGRDFETDILSKAHEGKCDSIQLQSYLDLLTQSNYLVRQSSTYPAAYSFSHHILQEVTYNTLLEEQRAALHLIVGKALEALRTKELERLALHYGKTSDRRKTLYYLGKAASKAQRAHANHTALTYYQQALSLGRRSEWLKGIIEVLHVLGRYEEANAYLHELDAVGGIPAFELAYLWGEHYSAASAYAKAEEAFRQALRVVRDQGELIMEVRCLNRLGTLAWRNGGRYEQAEEIYEQALAELGGWASYEMQEAEALVDTLNSLGTVYRQRGKFEAAEKVYRQALSLSREFKHRRLEARTLENLGSLAFHRRDFAAALPYHQASLRLCRVIGDRSGEADSLHNQALILLDIGDLQGCRKHLEQVQAIRSAMGNQWEMVNIAIERALLEFELGNMVSAQEILANGLHLAEQFNDLEGRAYVLSNLGLVLRELGELDAAREALEDGLTFMQSTNNQHQSAFFYSYLATVDLTSGRLLVALKHIRTAIEIHQQQKLRPRLADDLATEALIYLAQGDIAAARSSAEQVEQIIQECNGVGVEFLQRDWYVCYQVFLAAGQAVRAEGNLQAAYDHVQRRAKMLDEPGLRDSYLTKASINRAIVAAWLLRKRETGSPTQPAVSS